MIIRIMNWKGQEGFIEVPTTKVLQCYRAASRLPSVDRPRYFEDCLVEAAVNAAVEAYMQSPFYHSLYRQSREKAARAVRKYEEKMRELIRNWIRAAVYELLQRMEEGGGA